MTTSRPRVSVVIPWYRQQAQLDLVLAALDLQTLDPAAFEVIVADDGSPEPPVLGQHSYAVSRVRHEDKGFRASAARHLGVGASRGGTLCFLDADTVPEPAYLERLVASVDDGPRGTLVVGRRRHADLRGWDRDGLRKWLLGKGPGPEELPEPEWLKRGYEETDDLRRADDRSYRFVISAVMAMPRELYERAGGFDPSFVGYGGEDWDLAHRCWLAGADLRFVRDAVAWHDGPDFAGRDEEESLRVKDAETLRLAAVLTDPLARGEGLVWEHPETVVRVHGRPGPAAAALTAQSLLRGADAAVWFVDLDRAPEGLSADPRVCAGNPGVDQLQRCRHHVDVLSPLTLDRPLRELTAAAPLDVEVGGEVALRVRRTRDLARGDRKPPAVRSGSAIGVAPVPEGVSLEARWASWA